MTIARQVIAGRTYLITRRCTQRQFLLRPDPEVEQIYLYCLAEAAARYEVTLHGFVAMSNHQHIVLRDNRGNFPEFIAHLHKMIAKAMNARLGRWENFWATEQTNAVYLVEAADRFDKLIYVLANPVNADLVDRVTDWPGATSLGMHLTGRELTVARPRGYFSVEGKMPEEVTLRIERPEGFEELSEGEWRERIERALAAEEQRAREKRQEEGRTVLGRKAVLRAQPTERPSTLEQRRGLRPDIGCLNKTRRIEELKALLLFRATRAAALLRTLAGELGVLFPVGTYRIRGFFHVTPAVAAQAA
jgi:putative transposase